MEKLVENLRNEAEKNMKKAKEELAGVEKRLK